MNCPGQVAETECCPALLPGWGLGSDTGRWPPEPAQGHGGRSDDVPGPEVGTGPEAQGIGRSSPHRDGYRDHSWWVADSHGLVPRSCIQDCAGNMRWRDAPQAYGRSSVRP